MKTLQDLLDENTKEADLFVREGERIRCFACAHKCLLRDGQRGICKVRYVNKDKLLVPWGYVGALQVDPIEKKPFFHVLPGTSALSFGMLGCDYHCGYCQNWFTSQALRDPNAKPEKLTVSAEDLVKEAFRRNSKTIISTYNEPLITSEWGKHIFTKAREAGLMTGYVSNGNATPEVLEYIRPVTQLYKVDLKGFKPSHYAELGGNLQAVLDSIRLIKKMGFWLEIVTLIIPGFNDSKEELKEMAEFLVSISPDIPWHLTAFHPDYKMTDRNATSVQTLLDAVKIGKETGLNYIYAGNIPGEVGTLENTYCSNCRELLIERIGFRVVKNILERSSCPKCKTVIPGIWN